MKTKPQPNIGVPVSVWFDEEEKRTPGFMESIDAASARAAIATKVRELRTAAGLTQGALAAKCGVLQPSIGRVEGGRVMPTIEMLRKIARACDAELVVEFRETKRETTKR